MNARRVVIMLSAALSLLGSSSVVALQESTPEATPGGPPPLPEGCSVIASNLVNPRYVAVGDDGTIYVSEAGVGGDEVLEPPADPIATPDPAGTPAPIEEEGPPSGTGTRGLTGQVTVISPDGEQSVLVSELPSYSMGPESIGPAGITVADGQVLLAVGGAGPGTAIYDALPNENAVVSIDPETGGVTLLADIGAYERSENPEPYAIDSNLYGIAVGDDGAIYVNDAGGNATYRVPAGGGDPEVLAVHPGLPFPEGMEAPPEGNPFRDGAMELDPVPTGIVAVDDAVLVGLLSGGPFPPGAAGIVEVSLDGTISEVVTGMTMVVGLATGPDDQLYASQISTNFLGEVPAPGNVVRVLADGTQEVVLDGLVLPNGITFDQNGDLLVVVNAVSFGEPNGQLLRCDGVAETADASAAAASASEVTIAVDEMSYTPADLTVAADTDVTLHLVNNGAATHNVTIDTLGVQGEMLSPGEERTVTVNLPPGDYTFGCDVPGHRLAGMTGIIHAVA